MSTEHRVDPHVSLLMELAALSMPYIAGFYEASNGVPCPTYQLASWITKYEAEISPWPTWGVLP